MRGDLLPGRPAFALASACLLAGAMHQPAQAAGLLDFLFGGGPSPRYEAPPAYAPSSPLEMRVHPRRYEPRRAARPKPRAEPKAKLATPIDPKANPSWYLEDPTLRRGDIVVLKGKVLVFEGGRGRTTMGEFSSLSQSRLVSKSERARIESMAGLPSTAPTATAPPVATEAALKQPPSAAPFSDGVRVREVALRVAE